MKTLSAFSFLFFFALDLEIVQHLRNEQYYGDIWSKGKTLPASDSFPNRVNRVALFVASRCQTEPLTLTFDLPTLHAGFVGQKRK